MAQSDRCKEGTLIMRQAGESSSPNTFISIAPRAHLCESWMRENCTSSLSGGRRLAFGRLLRPDVRWAAPRSGGFKSHGCSDVERHIQKRG